MDSRPSQDNELRLINANFKVGRNSSTISQGWSGTVATALLRIPWWGSYKGGLPIRHGRQDVTASIPHFLPHHAHQQSPKGRDPNMRLKFMIFAREHRSMINQERCSLWLKITPVLVSRDKERCASFDWSAAFVNGSASSNSKPGTCE